MALRRVGKRRWLLLAALGLLSVSALAVAITPAGADLSLAISAAARHSPQRTRRRRQATPTPTSSTAPTAGCQARTTPRRGASVSLSMAVGSLTRDYRLHVPQSYRSNAPTPLVLAFHGHGTSAAPFERITRLSQMADKRDFLVVYPQGLVGPDGLVGWNTDRAQDPSADDVGFVSALVTHLEATLCVDTRRIYATGFSNGGGLVEMLACQLSDRLAAFAPVAGDYMAQPGGCHPSRAVSLLEIHGTADPIIPYEGSPVLGYPDIGAWLQDWATRDGCTADPTTSSTGPGVIVERWSACRNASTIQHDRLLDIGHGWPGGTAQAILPTPSATPQPTPEAGAKTFDADTAIWQFFATRVLAG
ncbi:MAG TPA: PHB depolymerase family esterase [Ktedonobacterales bacterium]